MNPELNDRADQLIHEMREWLQDNEDPDATDEEALETLANDCGLDAHGHCSMAGSEYCDWDCPFSR